MECMSCICGCYYSTNLYRSPRTSLNFKPWLTALLVMLPESYTVRSLAEDNEHTPSPLAPPHPLVTTVPAWSLGPLVSPGLPFHQIPPGLHISRLHLCRLVPKTLPGFFWLQGPGQFRVCGEVIRQY